MQLCKHSLKVFLPPSPPAHVRRVQARIQELEFLDAAVAAVSNEGGGGGVGGGVGGDGEPSSTPAGGLRDQVCVRVWKYMDWLGLPTLAV